MNPLEGLAHLGRSHARDSDQIVARNVWDGEPIAATKNETPTLPNGLGVQLPPTAAVER